MNKVPETSPDQIQPKIRKNYAKLELQLYTIIAIAYYVLNIVFPTDFSTDAANSSRIYPQIVAGMLAALCFFISFINIRSIWKSTIMRPFLLMLVLAILYVFYPMNPVQNIMYVSRMYMGILGMFTLYIILCNIRDERDWTLAIYIIYFFQIAFCLSSLIVDHYSFVASTEKEFDSNAGFLLITCVPLALTIPQKRIRLYVYAILILGCIYSGQRSAALAAVASLPFCLWYLKGSIKKSDVIIFAALAMVVATPLLIEAFQNFQVRNESDMNRGSVGSGRSVFWLIVIQGFFSGGPFQLIFGNGTQSVVDFLDRSYGLAIGAHNGWLDTLYTFGFLGIFLYGNIFWNLLKRNRTTNKLLPEYKNLYFILFLIFLIKSATSHGYFDMDMTPFLTSVAMMEGMRHRAEKKSEAPDVSEPA